MVSHRVETESPGQARVPDNARPVEAGWERIGFLARLDHRSANSVLADELAAEQAHAERTLVPLKPWPLLPKASFDTYKGGANHVRIRRVLDFIRAGDRILDVGTGYGYLSSVLVRDTDLDYYCGIDLTPRFAATSRQGLVANGLPAERHHFEVRNLYDLTPDFIDEHRPDLVLLLEVLEHVPDPGRAFEILGEVLPPGCAILFTVPLLGRLEGVWGHHSLYDEARIKELCNRGGFAIDHVEPVHNTWTLVLATRAEIAGRQTGTEIPPRDPLAGRYSFEQVRFPQDPADWTIGSIDELASTAEGIRIRTGRGKRGGLSLPINEPEVTRVEIAFEDPENLSNVSVEACDADGPRMSWGWRVTARNRPAERPLTFVFRNGRPARSLASSRSDGAAGVKALRIELKARRRRSTGATIRRAAYVPRSPVR